jgi:osmotically inducible protein OsmC
VNGNIAKQRAQCSDAAYSALTYHYEVKEVSHCAICIHFQDEPSALSPARLGTEKPMPVATNNRTLQAQMIRKAKATWRGTGRAGNGNLSTNSGVLAETPYSFKTRFENGKGTNPEELIAAAHAGCFAMGLAFRLQAAGYTPTELSAEAAVTIEPEGQGFRISRSALSLRAQVPNLNEASFARIAEDAEKNCAVSRVLKAEITLDAKLV